MEKYEVEQAIALSRERQHHIAVAARQLELLLALEEDRILPSNNNNDNNHHYNNNNNNFNGRFDENYVGVNSQPNKTQIGHGSLKTSEVAPSSSSSSLSPPPGKDRTIHSKDDDANIENDDCSDDDVVPPLLHPPTRNSSMSSMIRNRSNQSIAASILNYSDIGGLSTELKNVLNRSTLDPSSSLLLTADLSKSLFNHGSGSGDRINENSAWDDTLMEGSHVSNEQLQEKVSHLHWSFSCPSNYLRFL
jgi:hypothetical protein